MVSDAGASSSWHVVVPVGLHAVVGGNDVTHLFVVTEVYAEVGEAWALAGMSVTRLVTH